MMHKKLWQFLKSSVHFLSNPARFWVVVFCYTLLTGILVQFVLLPLVLPQAHAGNGLLIGVDAPKFHRIALRIVDEVAQQGWTAWELMPGDQLVSGMVALMYLLIFPAPWSVLPLNAFLNACAALCLFLIVQRIAGDRVSAVLATLPFVLFPSALLWNTQFHNENYVIPGAMGMLLGWVLAIDQLNDFERLDWRKFALPVVLIVTGSVLVGITRHRVLEGIAILGYVVASISALFWLWSTSFRRRAWVSIVLIFTLAGVQSFLEISIHPHFYKDVVQWASGESPVQGESSRAPGRDRERSRGGRYPWIEEAWLPEFFDDRFHQLANMRNRLSDSWKEAGSAIDTEVRLLSPVDVLLYIPRTVQIGMFAPFPDMWFTSGKKEAGDMTRAVSAIEMMFSYVALVALPYSVYCFRARPSMWALLVFCVGMISAYALVTPNVGSLYRFRYPFYLPLVGVGVVGWLTWFRDRGTHLALAKQ